MAPRHLLPRLPFLAALTLASRLASAQPTPTAALPAASPGPPVVARAPASGAQRELAVGFVRSGLRAKICPQPGCAIDDGALLEPPADIEVSRSTLTVVRIAKDRHLVHVVAPRSGRGGTWEALLAAPISGTEVLRLHVGETGLLHGEDGLRHGPMVMISEADADGMRRALVGQQREDISLCGRPTLISPTLVVPSDLALRPALVQRLSVAERNAAPELVARRAPADAAPAPNGMLRAVAATSAVGDPRSLADGDLETTWAEGRASAGKGEFAMLHAPATVPLAGLEFVSRPPTAARPLGAGPERLWVATERALFAVRFPADPFAEAGSRWVIDFPAPVTTDCLALVMDTTFDARPNAEVTLAEVRALSALGGATLDELVARLRTGDADAEAAGTVLASLGESGFTAVATAFEGLPESGRRVALQVMDAAPCAVAAPVRVRALLGPHAAQREHAEVRLLRCGAEAAPALLAALDRAKPRDVAQIEELLAVVAPADAVTTTLRALDGASAAERRRLRVLLARAAAAPAAAAAVRSALADPRLDAATSIELLRSLGPLLPRFQPEAGRALARLAQPSAPFRTRYLLAEPAAALAPHEPVARSWVVGALGDDPDGRVRARMAAAISEPTSLEAALLRAVEDREVRVRVAALETLARGPTGAVTRPVARLLTRDPWPMARAAAADLAAAAPADEELDRVLLAALRDRSAHVRRPVAAALGARQVAAAAAPLRKRLTDRDESIGVRVAAAGALASLCDPAAVEPLTRLARRFADPHDQSADRRVAPAAVTALGKLHPRDLAERLGPLSAAGAPPPARAAAAAALAAPASCGVPR